MSQSQGTLPAPGHAPLPAVPPYLFMPGATPMLP